MTQFELEKQVAQITGESISTIRSLGFGKLKTIMPIEERQDPLFVDWDLEQCLRNHEGRVV